MVNAIKWLRTACQGPLTPARQQTYNMTGVTSSSNKSNRSSSSCIVMFLFRPLSVHRVAIMSVLYMYSYVPEIAAHVRKKFRDVRIARTGV